MNNRGIIVVAGGAGFLGSHFCDKIKGWGVNILCVDNLITGSLANINHFDSHFQFAQIDIGWDEADDAIMQRIYRAKWEGPISLIANFASPASPVDYGKYPLETMSSGSSGVWNLINLAIKNNTRFVHASTSEVYGDPLQHPQEETYWGNANPVGPRSCYDEAKRFAEALITTCVRVNGLNAGIVRIFNTYGPRMKVNDGRAFPNFMVQALTNKPITIHGDGKQTRSLCYVDDLIDGVYKMACSKETGPINLGDDYEVDMNYLARLIKTATCSNSEIIYTDRPTDDPTRRCPDTKKAFDKLEWQATTSLTTGIQNSKSYFKKELGLE